MPGERVSALEDLKLYLSISSAVEQDSLVCTWSREDTLHKQAHQKLECCCKQCEYVKNEFISVNSQCLSDCLKAVG